MLIKNIHTKVVLLRIYGNFVALGKLIRNRKLSNASFLICSLEEEEDEDGDDDESDARVKREIRKIKILKANDVSFNEILPKIPLRNCNAPIKSYRNHLNL